MVSVSLSTCDLKCYHGKKLGYGQSVAQEPSEGTLSLYTNIPEMPCHYSQGFLELYFTYGCLVYEETGWLKNRRFSGVGA